VVFVPVDVLLVLSCYCVAVVPNHSPILIQNVQDTFLKNLYIFIFWMCLSNSFEFWMCQVYFWKVKPQFLYLHIRCHHAGVPFLNNSCMFIN
jgi:hypothetical protein